MLLAEHGADVARVEPVGGDVVRGLSWGATDPARTINWSWELTSRSKRGIALDLHQPQGRAIVRWLVEGAAVFLSNLRPAVLERAELDYRRVQDLNPRIIYANITGYGPRGPGTNLPSFDEIGFWARAGSMSVVGEPDTVPVPLREAMGDKTPMFTFGGIATALYVRERTGKGQRVDTSLLGSGCWVNGTDVQAALADGVGRGRTSPRERHNPLYNSCQAGCGRWFQFAMAQTGRFWPGLCRALDRPTLEGDPRFDTHDKRVTNNTELIAVLDEIFASRRLEEWASRFDDNGLIWGPAQTLAELIADPCVLANEYVVGYEHPAAGAVRGLGVPVRLGDSPTRPPRAAPEYGEHTKEILLGYDWHDIANFKSMGVMV